MAKFFGLDIGTYSIKLIQAEKKGKNFKLVSWGEIRTPANLESEAEKDQVALAEAIKKLIASSKTESRNVVLSLPETQVFSQIVQLPYLSPNELSSAINFEAEQYIPVPLNEVQLEYLVLKTPPKGALNEKMDILLVAAKKRMLDKVVKISDMVGLTPLVVETEVLSLLRNLTFNEKSAYFIVNLGHRSTNIMAVYEGRLNFIRTLNTGGEALTRAVAQDLNMEFNQAEQYKITYGVDQSQLEGKVAKAILPALTVIVEEIKKSFVFFGQKQEEKVKIKSLVLSGGGAEMPGLSSYLAKLFNIEVLIADPFVNFVKDEKVQKILGKPRLPVAVGLAQRNE